MNLNLSPAGSIKLCVTDYETITTAGAYLYSATSSRIRPQASTLPSQ